MRPQRPQQHPQAIDRAALARQFLAAAVDRVVDTGLPRLTQVDVGLRTKANVKNEATAPAAASRSPYRTTTQENSAAAAAAPALPDARAVDTGLHRLTPVDAGLPNSQLRKTNPPLSPSHERAVRTARSPRALQVSTLSFQQLAAARLLACGRSPAEVADEIGITRQALWKWRRRADFDAEVFRLHECLTWTAGATGSRRRRAV